MRRQLAVSEIALIVLKRKIKKKNLSLIAMSPVFDRKQPTMSSKSQQKSFKDEPKRVEHKT